MEQLSSLQKVNGLPAIRSSRLPPPSAGGLLAAIGAKASAVCCVLEV